MPTVHNPNLGDANEFLAENLKLIRFVSKRFRNNPHFDEEEFFSIGLQAITAAYEKFDPSRAEKFSTYAVLIIKGFYHRYIRYMTRPKRNPSHVVARLDDVVYGNGDSDDITLEQMIPASEDFTQVMVDEFISTLDDRERKALSLRELGYTQAEIAIQIGRSQVQTGRILKTIGELYINGDWRKKRDSLPKPKEEYQVRMDTWTLEEDETLKRTVMDFIRLGRTQLAAFEEAAQIIGRTPKSCGFRWNGKLRRDHEQEIAEIRPSRKYIHKSDRSQYMGIAFDPKLHKKIKVYSIIKEIPMGEIIDTAIREYMEKHLDEALAESI